MRSSKVTFRAVVAILGLAAISAAGGPAEYIEDGVRLIRGGQVARYSRKAIKADPKVDPKLQPGDVIEAEIERIGVLRNPVIGWQEAHGEPPPERVRW